MLENEGSDPSDISLFNFFFNDYQGFEGPDGVIVEGYSALLEGLIKRRKIQVHTACPVYLLNFEDSPLVSADCGTFRPHSVVMAIPLGVLQSGHPQFVPALPTDRTAAMSRLNQGVLNRLFFAVSKTVLAYEVCLQL